MTTWTSGYVADIGYTHGFYRELTPALLSLVTLAAGRHGPDAGGPLAYCELGCGQGFSANLLAAANPQVAFYATDFNPAHINGARALAQAAGTKNLHLFEQSFAEFSEEPSLPEFDIIALHGIYSWIADEHRQTIVDFIRKRLKPGGLVYISYNALPGWSAAAPLRHLMYLHGQAHGGPTIGRLDPALSFIEKMLDANALFFRANPLLKDRFEKLKGQNRNYLAHEYLNDAWTLLYHSDVARELGEAKLTYVGSAALLEGIDAVNLTPEQQKLMAEIADPVFRETVRDFLTNQQFRRDVFLRGPLPHTVASSRKAWSEKRFALSTRREDVSLTVKGSLGEAKLQEETYGPLLDALAKGPATVREILADQKVAALGWPRLTQALVVLCGAGHLQPCLPADGDRERAKRTKSFNAAVIAQAESSGDLQFLASPVTGGGVAVDRFAQLFLAARAAKHPDPVGWVWSLLAAQGQRLIKDGKALEAPDDNLAELRSRHEAFETKQLGVLQQLGIA